MGQEVRGMDRTDNQTDGFTPDPSRRGTAVAAAVFRDILGLRTDPVAGFVLSAASAEAPWEGFTRLTGHR